MDHLDYFTDCLCYFPSVQDKYFVSYCMAVVAYEISLFAELLAVYIATIRTELIVES